MAEDDGWRLSVGGLKKALDYLFRLFEEFWIYIAYIMTSLMGVKGVFVW